MEGFGVDDKTIVEILALRGNIQRLKIAEKYNELYNQSLIIRLQNELHGYLETLVLGLMTPLPDFYAKELYDAANKNVEKCGRLENDIEMILDLLCHIDNNKLRMVARTYKKCKYI